MKTAFTILILAVIVFSCHRKTVSSSDNIIISNKTNTETSKIENSNSTCPLQAKQFIQVVAEDVMA